MSFEEVKEVFVDTLNCDADKVTMNASLTDDLQADSLDAVELNMAFEDKFGVTIADEDLGTLKTVGDIFNYLAARAACAERNFDRRFLLSHLYCYNPYLGHMYEDFRPHLHSPPQ